VPDQRNGASKTAPDSREALHLACLAPMARP